MDQKPHARCRLILTLPQMQDPFKQLADALGGGDVASVILAANGLEEKDFLQYCKNLVGLIQEHECAAIVAGDSRIAGRADADGYLVTGGLDVLEDAIARFSPHKIVGYGGVRERHKALLAGELDPDFIFFGSLDKDIRPEPHKKNLMLGEWWSQMVEIPCAIMGGNVDRSAVDVAMSGAEFVVLGKAVFEGEESPGMMVGRINDLLDKYGPVFNDE